MTRLINADELRENMLYAMCGTGYQHVALSEIDYMPTVDAIPIEWLEEKLINHPEIPYVVTDGINAILDMWREENDTVY